MPTINGRACVVNGTPVDKVFSNGKQVYGRNLLINTSSSSNGKTMIPGAGTDIYGAYTRTDSYEQVTTPSFEELYYRPMVPNVKKLYGLTPGETYTLSGSASHTTGTLNFRAGYSFNGINWSGNNVGDLGIPVSDGSVFTPFSYTFTIPAGATGGYISLDNYNYTDGGLFRFRNIKLEEGSVATPWTPAPEDLQVQD